MQFQYQNIQNLDTAKQNYIYNTVIEDCVMFTVVGDLTSKIEAPSKISKSSKVLKGKCVMWPTSVKIAEGTSVSSKSSKFKEGERRRGSYVFLHC